MNTPPRLDPESVRRISESIECESASDDRSIVVRCRPGPEVVDIALNSRAFRLGSEELGERILGLVENAAAQAQEENRRQVLSLFNEEGTGDGVRN
ncbi:hypothetical protein [Salininema proteolyticum]|uniref:YbaB/EbfC DNA-binding family protein n=1 Tax=Salininema proteolyticum TaxID=1607685 RepID=A0ABV8U4V9_9ACTN